MGIIEVLLTTFMLLVGIGLIVYGMLQLNNLKSSDLDGLLGLVSFAVGLVFVLLFGIIATTDTIHREEIKAGTAQYTLNEYHQKVFIRGCTQDCCKNIQNISK